MYKCKHSSLRFTKLVNCAVVFALGALSHRLEEKGREELTETLQQTKEKELPDTQQNKAKMSENLTF